MLLSARKGCPLSLSEEINEVSVQFWIVKKQCIINILILFLYSSWHCDSEDCKSVHTFARILTDSELKNYIKHVAPTYAYIFIFTLYEHTSTYTHLQHCRYIIMSLFGSAWVITVYKNRKYNAYIGISIGNII